MASGSIVQRSASIRHPAAVVMDHSVASELLGVYALDACEADEAAGVERHLSACSVCAGEAVRLTELAGWIGVSEAVSPSLDLRTKVMIAAQAGQPVDPAA